MTGPLETVSIPLTSVFSSASPRGTLRVSRKQNSLFPEGPVIKCLILHEKYKKVLLLNNFQFEISNNNNKPGNFAKDWSEVYSSA